MRSIIFLRAASLTATTVLSAALCLCWPALLCHLTVLSVFTVIILFSWVSYALQSAVEVCCFMF